ncbi:MAG: GNAT family N-acetyltransferase [Pyrinomonadaceae bacterium]
MNLFATERLSLREITSGDAGFVAELLNTPKFLKYIGDRGVRSSTEAAEFIETRYRQSYIDHGYGLYAVDQLADRSTIGICGYVRRESLAGPDLGFAFLPAYERRGFGFESASATLNYGRDQLGFHRVFAITTLYNDASVALLYKLGFTFDCLMDDGVAAIKRFAIDL